MKKFTKILAVLAAMTTLTVSAVPVHAEGETAAEVSENGLISDFDVIQKGLENFFETNGIKANVFLVRAVADNIPKYVEVTYFYDRDKAAADRFIEEQHYDTSVIKLSSDTDEGACMNAEILNPIFEEKGIAAYVYDVNTGYPDTLEGKAHVFYYDDALLPSLKKIVAENAYDPDIAEYVKGEKGNGDKVSDIFEIKRLLDDYLRENGYINTVRFENKAFDPRDNRPTGDALKVHLNIMDYSKMYNMHLKKEYIQPDAAKSFIEQANIDENALDIEVYDMSKNLFIKPNPNADRGDANEDGDVNVRDCAFIAKKLAKGKGSELPEKADFNLDDNVDVRDAAALARALASTVIP